MAPDPIEIYVRHVTDAQRPLYNFILTLVPNLADADDVLGETNTVLWRKRDDFNPAADPTLPEQEHFLRFARTVARYQALAHFKKKQRDHLRFDDGLLDTLARESAERAGQLDAKRHALAGCLAQLSDKDRDLVERRYQSGARADAIAEAVGRSANAVYQALHRIRQALLVCVRHRMAEAETVERSRGGDA